MAFKLMLIIALDNFKKQYLICYSRYYNAKDT